MNILNQIQSAYSEIYQAYKSERQSYQDKIDESERKIEWHKRRKERYEKRIRKMDFPHWTDNLVRPVMREIERLTPDIVWEERDRLPTFGIRCECPVFGKTAEGHTVGICFTPGSNIEEKLWYDTGEVKARFSSGTIGEINGMNNVSKPVDSIEELIAFVRQKELTAKERHSKTNPITHNNTIMAGKGISTTAEPLDYGDYLRLVEALEADKKYRWELYCILACAFALRAKDALNIKWGDVLYGDLYVVVENKTKKARRIPINSTVRAKLFFLYEKMGRPEIESLVFISKRTGRPYTTQNVNTHLRNYIKKYSLPISHFSTHSFRKTFGMKYFKDNGENERALIVLSRELNHSTPGVTRRYIGIPESEYAETYNAITFNTKNNGNRGQIQRPNP